MRSNKQNICSVSTHTHTQRCVSNLNNTQSCHPELVSGSCSKIADQARNDKRIKAFTLIELLVVVLIIAILAAIALPKYQVARDRAHLSGLMTIGKNVLDSLDRYTLMDDSSKYPALDRLDISFKSSTGSDCNSTFCVIKVSGKEYGLYPASNYSTNAANRALFYSLLTTGNDAFGEFGMYDDTNVAAGNNYRYNLRCHAVNSGWKTPDEDRCVRLGESMGATCTGGPGVKWCRWN